MSTLHQLALKESYARVPETCPAVRSVGVSETAKAHKWLHSRSWFYPLTHKQRLALETSYGLVAQSVCDGIRDVATLPLRNALATVIEEQMQASVPANRVAKIAAGQDAASLAVHGPISLFSDTPESPEQELARLRKENECLKQEVSRLTCRIHDQRPYGRRFY